MAGLFGLTRSRRHEWGKEKLQIAYIVYWYWVINQQIVKISGFFKEIIHFSEPCSDYLFMRLRIRGQNPVIQNDDSKLYIWIIFLVLGAIRNKQRGSGGRLIPFICIIIFFNLVFFYTFEYWLLLTTSHFFHVGPLLGSGIGAWLKEKWRLKISSPIVIVWGKNVVFSGYNFSYQVRTSDVRPQYRLGNLECLTFVHWFVISVPKSPEYWGLPSMKVLFVFWSAILSAIIRLITFFRYIYCDVLEFWSNQTFDW